MRTALIVAITLTFSIDAQAQTRADRSHRADLYSPQAKGALKRRHSVRRISRGISYETLPVALS